MAAIKGVSPSVTGTVSGNLGTWPVTGTITPVMPTGGGAPAAGDLLVIPVYNRITTATMNDVTGYTRLTTDNFTSGANTAELWAKIAVGGDTAPTCTSPTTSQPMAAIIIVIEDWSGDLADLVAAVAGSTGGTVTCPDASATEDGSLVLRIGTQQDDNQSLTIPNATPPPYVPWDLPAGHTSVFYEVTLSGSDAGMMVATETADTGAVGSAGFATNGNDAGIGFTLIIPPNGDVPPNEGTISAALVIDAALAGARPSAGALTVPVAMDVALTGSAPHQGTLSVPLVLDAALAGARPSGGALVTPLSLDCEVSGARESVAALTVPLVLDAQLSSDRPSVGTLDTELILDAALHGSNGQSGRPVQPYPWTPGPVSGYPWTPRPVKSFQEVPEP